VEPEQLVPTCEVVDVVPELVEVLRRRV